MPRKSQHGKGKHSSRRNRSKEKQRLSSVATPQQPVAETREPVSPSSTPAPVTKRVVTQYPHMAKELWTIGVLAVIVVVTLVVLALVLS
jgi:hypothetical protein